MPQFYRKKNAQGTDDFHEVGTDRYISETEFKNNVANFHEVPNPSE